MTGEFALERKNRILPKETTMIPNSDTYQYIGGMPNMAAIKAMLEQHAANQARQGYPPIPPLDRHAGLMGGNPADAPAPAPALDLIAHRLAAAAAQLQHLVGRVDSALYRISGSTAMQPAQASCGEPQAKLPTLSALQRGLGDLETGLADLLTVAEAIDRLA
jgi:hypothetical protein